MLLLDEVVFKIFPEQQSIILFSIHQHPDYIFTLKSEKYCGDIHDFITKSISYSQLQSRLPVEAFMEFESTWRELEQVFKVQTDKEIAAGIIFSSESFSLIAEALTSESEIDVSARMATSYEGIPCPGQVGTTYCDTTITPATELWECVPGSPDNWAMASMSC